MATARRKTPSAIPVGTQFSPDLINLSEFLRATLRYSGNKSALIDAIWQPPVHLTQQGVPASSRRASLPLEAAVQYGLLTRKTYQVTDLARHLASLPETQLHEEFARHIMLKLGGLRVVEGAQQMRIDNLPVNADSLARYLTQQNFQVTEHNTAINSLRMWLAKAGVFSAKGWEVDATRKQAIAGLSDDQIATLVNFDEAQRAFVKALCRINPPDWYKAADVRDLAETTFGVRLGRTSLPNEVLVPLEEAGLIEFDPGGTQGGKSSRLKTTAAFNTQVLEPFVNDTVKTLDPGIIAYYRMLPADIYQDLGSKENYVKGRALEAYAIFIMRLLGLHFMGWRKRPKQAGYAEVDVLLTGLMGSTSTRWQVQCKNTPSQRVELEDVAKEVGLTPLSHATHILIIANCNFTGDARRFANEIMLNSALTIHLLDKKDYQEIENSPGAIGRILREQAIQFARLQPKGSLWKA